MRVKITVKMNVDVDTAILEFSRIIDVVQLSKVEKSNIQLKRIVVARVLSYTAIMELRHNPLVESVEIFPSEYPIV